MISGNITTIILIIVIIGVVGVDWFLKSKKKTISKELTLENETKEKISAKSKNLIIYLSLLVVILGYGFYEFYLIPKNLIAELNNNINLIRNLPNDLSEIDEERNLNSKNQEILKKLDQKWFKYGDYEKLRAYTISHRINLNYSTVSTTSRDLLHNYLNFFRCIYTREKNDSLISFLKEKTKLYNRYKLTDYFDHNTFNKGKVNIKLLELFSETKCGETFFLSKIKSSKIKNEFINEFENYKQNNKDEESLSYIKKIELYIEPSPLNIYQYLNNKKPQKRFINCLEIKNETKKIGCYSNSIVYLSNWRQKEIDELTELFAFLLNGRNVYQVASSEDFTDVLFGNIISKSIIGLSYKDLNFRPILLRLYLENNAKFLYSIFNYDLDEDAYLKLNKSSKKNFKNFIETYIFENEIIDLNKKSGLIRSYIKSASIDKNYTEIQNGLKQLNKILEEDNISRYVYSILADAYNVTARYEFDRSDWLGAIESYEKAIDFISNAKKISEENYYDSSLAFYYRNLFAAKWNYKENGDKMGACDDLRRAKDLDGDNYSYYIKNCGD